MSKPSEDKKKRRLARKGNKDEVKKYVDMLFDFRAQGFETVRFADGRTMGIDALLESLRKRAGGKL